MKNEVRNMQKLIDEEKSFNRIIVDDIVEAAFPKTYETELIVPRDLGLKNIAPVPEAKKRETKYVTLTGLRARFNLTFRIKTTDELQVAMLLKENFEDEKYSINKCEFIGFKRIALYGVMVREAELVRVLLKQIKTYE